MSLDQILFFLLLGVILGLMLWGRMRHDLVAAAGLFIAIILGFVPEDVAFSGFSNPAVLIVALVLIASRALENSGALNFIGAHLAGEKRSVPVHVMITSGVGALLSAVINNVAALAMLMPLDNQAAQKAKRPLGLTLMPLGFATILGGMITLIGTPPNIIAAAFREKELGAPYQMFDFTPVGLAVAAAGLLFVALIGWRLIPRREAGSGLALKPEEFLAELSVATESPVIGKVVAQLDADAEKSDVFVVGLERAGKRLPGRARFADIREDDILIVEGSTDALAAFIKATGLQAAVRSADDGEAEAQVEANGAEPGRPDTEPADTPDPDGTGREGEPKESAPRSLAIVEAVVRTDSPIAWRTAKAFKLRSRYGVTLLGIVRGSETLRKNLSDQAIHPGDLLLISGTDEDVQRAEDWLGLIPMHAASVAKPSPYRIGLAVGLFAAAITVAATGFLSFTTTIAIAAAAYAATGLVPAREFYQQIEWSVVVMLACLLPLGVAFDHVGGTSLVTGWLLDLTQGQPPVVALICLMVVTMTLSDVLNNVATMVIAAPIALTTAAALHVNPDTFLMGVAVAASCAFLTPIGHKNNTLIMGPGGYRFGDYWRLGLPLEIIVLVVAVPMLLWVWPL